MIINPGDADHDAALQAAIDAVMDQAIANTNRNVIVFLIEPVEGDPTAYRTAVASTLSDRISKVVVAAWLDHTGFRPRPRMMQ